MEVDMQPIPLRATRSSTKRARSPSSPGQYDRPSKRVSSSGHDTSVPISFPHFQTTPASHGLPNIPVARLRNMSQDWVSQTQSMRLESPASEQGGFSTPPPVTTVDDGGQIRVDEVMADEPMLGDEMSISPQRLSHSSSAPGAPSPSPSQYLHPPDIQYPSAKATLHPQNPNRLQIPAIQIQAATPSPVQMYDAQPRLDSPALTPSSSMSETVPGFAYEDASMLSPSSASSPTTELRAQHHMSAAATAKRQRFTMGPRADCELCRQRVKGHYMHFD
ncbi:hypothetical protein GY45DRAFT_1372676 [Cubamyces sp. BRFM 1775]|nr:hypothetical protein GY45DRAFT_1372676 [Cubamyces sp. BRFM 1775]